MTANDACRSMLKHLIPIVIRMEATRTKQRFEVIEADERPGWYRLRDRETGLTLLGLYASPCAASAAVRRAKLAYCRTCDRELPVNSVTVRNVVGCAATGHRKSVVHVTVRCAGCGELHQSETAPTICDN